MSYGFESRLGEYLYDLLPEVYRTRDKQPQGPDKKVNQDLARYLDVHGELLDLIHATFEQQLRDTLPQDSQDWLLPYFAQLLATDILSPVEQGKHAEVANAVIWHQKKGTIKVAEQISEGVGQIEAEVQEGWKRVAITPRVDMPLVPAKVTDNTLDLDMDIPNQAIRHPELAVAMVDFRRPSRAIRSQTANPATRFSYLAGVGEHWRQLNRHGVPCFPDSFDDVSRRTVDLRRPHGANGRYHHKSLLAYVTPPTGLIPLAPITISWAQRHEPAYENLIVETVENDIRVIRNNTKRRIRISDNVVLSGEHHRIEYLDFDAELAADGVELELHYVEANRVDIRTLSTDRPVLSAFDSLFGELSSQGHIKLARCSVVDRAFLPSLDARDCLFMAIDGTQVSGLIEFSRVPAGAPFSDEDMRLEDCTTDVPSFFANQTALDAKAVLSPDTPASIHAGGSDNTQMGYFRNGRENRPVRIKGNFTAADALNFSGLDTPLLMDVIFTGEIDITGGNFDVQRVAFNSLTLIDNLLTDERPVLNAVDCLFESITALNGLVRLEYCTVMQQIASKRLQASDCIFAGSITDGAGGEPESGCVRYSRVPTTFSGTTLNLHPGFNGTNTRDIPIFTKFDFCSAGLQEFRIANISEPGRGVLHQQTTKSIRFGAEDGGEMGAGHHKYYSLKIEAVIDKLKDFLPVGIDPLVIYDRRLLHRAPLVESE